MLQHSTYGDEEHYAASDSSSIYKIDVCINNKNPLKHKYGWVKSMPHCS